MHLLDNDSAKDRLHDTVAIDRSMLAPIAVNGRLLKPASVVNNEHLDALEAQSIYIFREAFARLKKLALLWSLGKDSNVGARSTTKPKMPSSGCASQAISEPHESGCPMNMLVSNAIPATPTASELAIDTSVRTVLDATDDIERMLVKSGILFEEPIDLAANI